MISRFVNADVVTLPLSNGDSLTVRRRLNAGESRERIERMTEQVDGELRVKLIAVPMATMTAYLLDWTFTDDTGARMPIRGLSQSELESTLNNLDPEDFREVREAIDAHHAATQAEAEKKRAGLTGASESSQTLPLPVDVVGGSNG